MKDFVTQVMCLRYFTTKKQMVFLYESNLGIFFFVLKYFSLRLVSHLWGNIYYPGRVFPLRQLNDGIQNQRT